jgi:hypothetical protein
MTSSAVSLSLSSEHAIAKDCWTKEDIKKKNLLTSGNAPTKFDCHVHGEDQ